MIKPTKTFVVIKRDPPITVHKNIHFPENAKELSDKGTVVAVGKDIKCLEVGQRIRFIWSAGFLVKDNDGQEYYVMKEHDVLAEEI